MPSKFAEHDAKVTRDAEPLTRCVVCRWLMNAEPEDRDYIDGLLRQPVKVKGHRHIQRVLALGDVEVSADNIRDHRLTHLDRQLW